MLFAWCGGMLFAWCGGDLRDGVRLSRHWRRGTRGTLRLSRLIRVLWLIRGTGVHRIDHEARIHPENVFWVMVCGITLKG